MRLGTAAGGEVGAAHRAGKRQAGPRGFREKAGRGPALLLSRRREWGSKKASSAPPMARNVLTDIVRQMPKTSQDLYRACADAQKVEGSIILAPPSTPQSWLPLTDRNGKVMTRPGK